MRVFVFSLLGFACVGICIWRYDVLMSPIEKDQLYPYVDKKIEVKGIVIEEAVQAQYAQKLSVQISEADGKPANEILLVSAPTSPPYVYGDGLDIKGTIRLPQDFAGSSGEPFAYIKYLEKSQIKFLLKATSVSKKNPHPVQLIAHGKGNPVIDALLRLKLLILVHIRRVLPSPESGLFEGLVLGENTLPMANQDDFRHAGIIHIVVLSGYNMTLVSEAISGALTFLPFAVRLAGSATGVVLFAIMAGPSATVVRATLMVLLSILARATGRLYDVKRALWVTAALMIMQNPLILFYDPSFQLSFLATFGLMYFSPLFQKLFSLGILAKWPKWALKEIMISTCATQVMVLPFLIHMTGYLSIISMVSNCAVLPFIPFAMAIGSTAAALTFISLKLAYLPVYFSYLILSYIIWAAHFFANIPYSSIPIPASWRLTGGIYSLYFAAWLGLRLIKSRDRMLLTRSKQYFCALFLWQKSAQSQKGPRS